MQESYTAAGSSLQLISAEIKSTPAGGIRTVNVTVTAPLLKPDNYILELTGLTATGAASFAGSYAFRVVPR